MKLKKPSKSVALLALVCLVVVGAAFFWWAGSKPTQAKWVLASVDQGAIIQRVTANGTLNPVVLVNVGTQISGTVLRLHTDFNEPVKAGQLLAELDPSLIEAQIRQSEANLLSAKAVLTNAELALKRSEQLKAKGFVSDGALDGLRRDVETASAQVLQSQAQVARDRTNLGYSRVRSPIDGIVVNRGIDVGQTVAASFQTPTLFQIARDLQRMQIDTSVAEADVGAIAPNQPVRFTVDAFQDQDFSGKVRMVRLNPTTQQNVVTYNVVIDVDNKDGRLLPGMTAQVTIVTNRKDDVIRVPATALRFRPPAGSGPAIASGGNTTDKSKAPGRAPPAPKVYLADAKGELQPRDIKVGMSDGRFTEVAEGLAVGEQVVTRAAADNGTPASTGFRFRLF
jgi:HlyD family secretion protein